MERKFDSDLAGRGYLQSIGYMDINELSRFLAIPVATLRQYCSKGTIPYIRVPGSSHIRFSQVAIDAWMQEGSIENG